MKKDLSFITKLSIKTNKENVTKKDISLLVKSAGVYLYCCDIDNIIKIPGGFKITVSSESSQWTGSFKIKYRNYVNKGNENG